MPENSVLELEPKNTQMRGSHGTQEGRAATEHRKKGQPQDIERRSSHGTLKGGTAMWRISAYKCSQGADKGGAATWHLDVDNTAKRHTKVGQPFDT